MIENSEQEVYRYMVDVTNQEVDKYMLDDSDEEFDKYMIDENDQEEKKEPSENKMTEKEDTNMNSNSGKCCEIGPLTPLQRRKEAYEIRENAAEYQRDLPLPNHPCNGDEDLYPNKIGNFTKTLPHNELGEVDIDAYNVFIRALTTGNPSIFEAIPLGGVMKLADPQGSYAYDLMGPDSHHLTMMIPPTFSSAWRVSEMAEVYWGALT